MALFYRYYKHAECHTEAEPGGEEIGDTEHESVVRLRLPDSRGYANRNFPMTSAATGVNMRMLAQSSFIYN